jgi:hypothetical protein
VEQAVRDLKLLILSYRSLTHHDRSAMEVVVEKKRGRKEKVEGFK